MARACAVDYGRTRTGVAVSDPSRTLVGETVVINEKNERILAQKLCALFDEKGISAVAVGLPLNMDGTMGPQGERCRHFAALLSQMSRREVTLIDERRTTVDAHRILSENGVFRQKRKETVDAVAASLILEIYLKKLRSGGENARP